MARGYLALKKFSLKVQNIVKYYLQFTTFYHIGNPPNKSMAACGDKDAGLLKHCPHRFE
jgi:hypothetical protein